MARPKVMKAVKKVAADIQGEAIPVKLIKKSAPAKAPSIRDLTVDSDQVSSFGFNFGSLEPAAVELVAKNPRVKVTIKIESRLLALLIKIAPSSKKSALSELANFAIKDNIRNMERLIPVALSAQQQVGIVRSIVLSITIESATLLKAAMVAIKEHGFTKITVGKLVVGCLYLHATEQRGK